MCALFPLAVAAGKHTFERILKEDKAKAEGAYNKAYAGRKKAYVSNAVRIFKANNPDADFRTAQMKKNIAEIEVHAKNKYLADYPKKPFVYVLPKLELPVETDPVRFFEDTQAKISNIAAEAKRKADADIAAGRALPQT